MNSDYTDKPKKAVSPKVLDAQIAEEVSSPSTLKTSASSESISESRGEPVAHPQTQKQNLEKHPGEAENQGIDSQNTVGTSLGNSNQEFYQLQTTLYRFTLGLTVVIFTAVCIFYSLNTGLNYLIGAGVGVFYLRLLAKDVERLGHSNGGMTGFKRLAPFIGLIIFATQLEQLEIVPVFLGFMTYKAAIIVYVLQSSVLPTPK